MTYGSFLLRNVESIDEWTFLRLRKTHDVMTCTLKLISLTLTNLLVLTFLLPYFYHDLTVKPINHIWHLPKDSQLDI